MKFIKITTLCLLILSVSIASAEIKIRTVSPNFSIEEVKYNRRIDNATNSIYITHKNDVSYIKININKPSTPRQTIYNNEINYYHQYSKTTTQSQNVLYNNHITMKSYNVANRTPFDGGEATINTTGRFNAFGPPTEGPISDIIWSLLIFAGIYLFVIKFKKTL